MPSWWSTFCNDFWNMIIYCHACDSSKRNLSVHEWLDSDVDKTRLRLLKKKRLTKHRKWQAYAKLLHNVAQLSRWVQEYIDGSLSEEACDRKSCILSCNLSYHSWWTLLDTDVNKYCYQQMNAQNVCKHWLLSQNVLALFLTCWLLWYCFSREVPTRYETAHVFTLVRELSLHVPC